MIVERKFGFAKLSECCCREKLPKEVILRHSKPLPGLPSPPPAENTHVKTSITVKTPNPNLQEVSKSRVLAMVSSVFPWLRGASPGTPAQGTIEEQDFTACVMSDQTTRGTQDEAIKTQRSPQEPWLKAAAPRLCSALCG